MEKNLVREMLPYKLQQLLEAIIEEKELTVNDAIQYLYSSDLYKQMSLEDSYLWQLSKANLYDMLQTEKNEKRLKEDNSGDILLFLSFCIENYKGHKSLSEEEVLFLFSKYDVLNFLGDVYDTLHTQGKDYIMSEIDEYIDNRK
ncbi:DUF3791 domain-containing protein [Parabacteroides sp. PF5-6]|uniref:DUF3791 domain-containing protein n=1 Tax=Parabacteroides sp. PF5-6 TaxID=1742403 RepID=UPI002404DB8B|nr:DUF3791 domain-containing protein [Parabacteroides sp. PF5-6]MDF9831639.1 hypothetical protein [Parabacteroides sp. PF5-6]